MLEGFISALIVGITLGFLSGLGVGGGSLLILWLTMVLGMDHNTARGINLLFFLPTASIACWLHWRSKSVRFRPLLPAIVGGCLTAAILSRIGMQLDLAVIRKLFGGLLILTGLRELLYKPRKRS